MREYPRQPVVGVGAVIIENGKILLVKRGNEPNKDMWSIPGGIVKVGESLIDALKREVEEEVGLKVEVRDVACVSEEIIEENGKIKFHYVIIDFFAEVVGGELRPNSDALDAKWVDLDDLDSIEVVDFVRKLAKRLKSGKEGIYLR
jgi:ADP-ribose pyrophosphatase YjhB (NUDIX family)